MDSAISAKKKADGRKASATGEWSLKDHYLEQLELVPGVKKLIGKGTLKESDEYRVQSAADFSYAADKYAGDHYRLIGDASGKSPVPFGEYKEIKGSVRSIYRSLLFEWSPPSTSWRIDRCG